MISAIVTVYFPSEIEVNNIELISMQVNRIFVIDNSCENNEINFRHILNLIYVNTKKNLGTAAAFNHVLSKYYFDEDEYIIFFDQDSRIKGDHVKRLIKEYQCLENKCNIGCLGPQINNASRGEIEIPKNYEYISETGKIVKGIIASSMISKYSIIKRCGFWNDSLFLDFADWDFCWRLNSHGYCCVLTSAVVLEHKVGEGDKVIGKLKVRNSSPIRSYYQTRDGLKLIKESYIPVIYRMRYLLDVFIKPVLGVCFLDYKWKRINYAIRGFKDFFLDKNGEIK